MNSITLRFYESASFASRLIELTGRFSHVDVVSPPKYSPMESGFGMAEVKQEGAHIIYDSATESLYGSRSDKVGGQPPGVRLRQPYGGKTTDLTLSVTDLMHADFWKFLWDQNGKPYDHLAILAFVIERNWRDNDSWVCSELIAAALEAAEILPSLCVHPNKITPGTLAVAFQALGAKAV